MAAYSRILGISFGGDADDSLLQNPNQAFENPNSQSSLRSDGYSSSILNCIV